MKSLTIHALDEQLAAQIKQRAREQSVSMNEVVKQLLAESLGTPAAGMPEPLNNLMDRGQGPQEIRWAENGDAPESSQSQ